jgi:cytochrome P450
MRDREKHSQRRRLLAHPLSNSSLQDFEPLIQAKIDLAVQKIADERHRLGYADIYKWFSLMATDIIGDLTFGSSLRMLEQGQVSRRDLAWSPIGWLLTIVSREISISVTCRVFSNKFTLGLSYTPSWIS